MEYGRNTHVWVDMSRVEESKVLTESMLYPGCHFAFFLASEIAANLALELGRAMESGYESRLSHEVMTCYREARSIALKSAGVEE